MKIIDIKTFVTYAYRTNFIFVKIFTDEGLTGVGEGTLEYKESACVGAIEHIKRALINKNPMHIEKNVHDLYRDSYWREGAVLQTAISAVEIAMWDLKGKFLNVPVMDLLGGPVREEIKMYANGWFAGAKTPDEFAEKARIAVSKGVKALKWDPFGKAYMEIENKDLMKALECVEAVRDAVGNDVDLLIEGHGRFNIPTAIKIANELKSFNPKFFEEPTPPDNLDAIAEVRRKSPIPIAAGERIYSMYNFREFLNKGCADYVQLDVTHCGGIMALKKMAAMAESHYIGIAPHNPSGPIANAATLQLAGNLMNFTLLEIMLTDVNWRKELTDEKIVFNEGFIEIPNKPGLGINIDENACKKYPYQPIDLRHYSGNLTDIRPEKMTDYYFEGI